MLPCNHQIWSYWAPRSERTILVTIALAGKINLCLKERKRMFPRPSTYFDNAKNHDGMKR